MYTETKLRRRPVLQIFIYIELVNCRTMLLHEVNDADLVLNAT